MFSLLALSALSSASCSGGSSSSSAVSSSNPFIPNSDEAEVVFGDYTDADYLYSAKDGDAFSALALEQSMAYGDSVLYEYGDYDILVDGGMPGLVDSLTSVLKKRVTDGVLELLILTHQHYDHFGSLTSSVLQNAGITSVTTFIDNGVVTFNNDYKNIWEEDTKPYLIANGSVYHPIQEYFDGTVSSVLPIAKDVTLAFLDNGYFPRKNSEGIYVSHGNPNEESIGFVLYAGDYEFVSLADGLATTEANYMTKYENHPFIKEEDTVIFKGSHHCNENANSEAFLDFIDPDYCFVMSAIIKDNSGSDGIAYGQLPYRNVRERIEEHTGKKNLYWTSTTGNLEMSLDSLFTSLSIHGEGRKIGTYYSLGQIVDPEKEKDLPCEETTWAKDENGALGV